MTPRARWHVLNFGPAVILATVTMPSLAAAGTWLAALAVLFAAMVVAIQAWSFRSRYKTGWHDGRVDLMRELRGDPDHRATGKAPEPWTPRQPLRLVPDPPSGEA